MMDKIKDEQWDILKIVCRQPYNPNMQYGLSFVKVRGIGNESTKSKESITKSPVSSNQSALKSFFGINNNSDNNNNNKNHNKYLNQLIILSKIIF